jgi:DNA excision repair protein ERCC-2
MSSNRVVKISVRNLVEFVLRSGDLVSAFTGSSRMVDGGKIHRKIQQAQGPEYEPEVSLAIVVERPGVTLHIGGRADGVIVIKDETGNTQVTVDEIKSTTAELEIIEEDDNPLHWAQAKCYAYIYAVQHNLAEIHVQVSYCQAVTLQMKTFNQSCSVEELTQFFEHLINQYVMWAKLVGEWIEVRDEAAQQLQFPFADFRQGQRQLAVAVYKALSTGRKLCAQAPTGTGKTIATIFPAVKAMGMGQVEKIFFLTAKTVTRQLAEEVFDRLRKNGLRFKTVTLTAKEKICFMPEAACTPDECPYAKGYYDRIGPALKASWQLEAFTREAIEQQAREHQICPFEFTLDLALWADAVICDYNYVFDPSVYLKRFFQDNYSEYCLLVDEAHNLVDRARDMFSAEISKHDFLAIKKDVSSKLPRLAKAAGKINTFLLQTGKLCVEKPAVGQPDCWVTQEAPDGIFPLLRNFSGLAEKWLANNEPAEFRETLLELYFKVYAFLRTGEMYDERYVTYAEKLEKDVRLKLFCVNPSELLRQVLARGRGAVFFSATLTPLDYFFEMLGGEEGDGKIAIASPFSPENLGLLVADTISTTYKMRDKTYEVVVESITAAIGARTGNYMVFLPSYRYMEEVVRRFCLRNPAVKVIRQVSGMAEEHRTDFLRHFSVENKETLVGFAVLGGIFGEGIDLTGERLVGAVVVGVGLPQVCLEREIIRNWFTNNNRQGFEYAYVYPGMNKVLQAVGRVIRTENDRGLILLIDDRFSQARYKRLFPDEWYRAVSVKTVDSIADKAGQFW